MTREEWLKRAVRVLRPLLRKAGIKMRARWQVSMSFTARKSAIGLCCYEAHSKSGQTVNIMICPSLGDPVDVLSTLMHEMIHAALPYGAHHGPKFKKACDCIGLVGKPTEAYAGPILRSELERVAKFLGPFPHDAFVFKSKGKSGTKGGYWPVYCSPADARYRVQVSAKALEEFGPPTCPITGEQMVPAVGRAPKW